MKTSSTRSPYGFCFRPTPAATTGSHGRRTAAADQITWIDAQSRRQLPKHTHARGVLCALDIPQMTRAQARAVGQFLLCQTLGVARLTQVDSQDRHEVHAEGDPFQKNISRRHFSESTSEPMYAILHLHAGLPPAARQTGVEEDAYEPRI